MTHVQHLFNENQAGLDRVAFKLRLAELMDLELEPLRQALSVMANDTPNQCLQLCAAMLSELRDFKSVGMCDKRKAVFYAAKRALDVLEQMEFELATAEECQAS
ncbi:hypothetical protein LZP69_10505 [Shewanella sp. AS1]|uniref:hypothetical protein n=1 Tax=Shewanella sp. AS1 TaxID=2907626 RepID=UPI001F36F57B|nr:hypothetical protein [Shewanella sp. AS1]MCE9679590.1 hypothetical protein [Shewanella sp. AS1]